jgi:hypothetical protein
MSKNAAAKHRKNEARLKQIRRDETARRNALANRLPASSTRMANDAQTLQKLSGGLEDMVHRYKDSCGHWKETGKLKEEGNWEYIAEFKCDAVRILRLLDEVKNVESRHERKTALMIVSEAGFTALAKFLVEERNADVDAKRAKTNETALMLAAKNGHAKTVDYLLEERADPNAQDTEGRTALMSAVTMKNLETIKLLSKCTDNKIQNMWGETALIVAAAYSERGASVLLEAMPKRKSKEILNMQDNDGRTALMRAAQAGHERAITELQEKGADLNIQDKDGLTLLDHMHANRHSFEISLRRDLRKKGAETRGELELDAEMRAAGVSEEKIRESRREMERMRNFC